MSFLFGSKQPTQKEMVRDQKRQLGRQARDLDRELLLIERDEKKTQLEIKKLAAAGQMGSAKVLAKSIMQLRKRRDEIYLLKSRLSSTSVQVATAATQSTMTKAVGSAARVMGVVNQQTPLRAMQQTAQQFEKQNEMMSMKEEMVSDLFDDDELDEAADEQVAAVLDEIGLDVSEQISKAKTPGSALPQRSKAKSDAEDKELEQLLQRLGS